MNKCYQRMPCLAFALLLAGCASVNPLAGKKEDYRDARLGQPLEVPPDLTRPDADTRYTVPTAPAPVAIVPAQPTLPQPPALDNPVAAPGVAPAAPTAHAVLTKTSGGAGMLLMNEPMEQAWRRVGIALERGHVTIEDRNRSQGLYYVRSTTAAAPGWRFWQHRDPAAGQLWRVRLAPHGEFVEVTVLDDHGLPSGTPTANLIINQLYTQLK